MEMTKDLFEEQKIISTISYSQDEIINNIIHLYCPDGIECDPTFSRGNFYKNIPPPKYKYDLIPQVEGVIKSDCRSLPLKAASVRTLMFDPPFIGGTIGNGKKGIIKERFGIYKNIPTLWEMYIGALKEFYRVLEAGGVLIFKCQDTIESSKQYLSEYKIIKEAIRIGYYPKDKFILLAKSRLVSPSQRNQQHARKFHSYFLVFVKQKCRVDYEYEGIDLKGRDFTDGFTREGLDNIKRRIHGVESK